MKLWQKNCLAALVLTMSVGLVSGTEASITSKQQDDVMIKIVVNEGTAKPYFLKKKGLKSSGVFVRQGVSSVPASDAEIRRMIKETDGDNFESMRSLRQDLTFVEVEKAFREYGVEFG